MSLANQNSEFNRSRSWSPTAFLSASPEQITLKPSFRSKGNIFKTDCLCYCCFCQLGFIYVPVFLWNFTTVVDIYIYIYIVHYYCIFPWVLRPGVIFNTIITWIHKPRLICQGSRRIRTALKGISPSIYTYSITTLHYVRPTFTN